jgi:hypothetical protein
MEKLLRAKPRGRKQTHGNPAGKNDRQDKKISPAHKRESGKANGEGPRNAAHACQSLCRKAAQLPREYRSEYVKDSDGESGRLKQVPIRSVKALHIKMNRAHGGNKRVNSPLWVRLAKAKCVSNRKKQQKNSSDPIDERRFHILPPDITSSSLQGAADSDCITAGRSAIWLSAFPEVSSFLA